MASRKASTLKVPELKLFKGKKNNAIIAMLNLSFGLVPYFWRILLKMQAKLSSLGYFSWNSELKGFSKTHLKTQKLPDLMILSPRSVKKNLAHQKDYWSNTHQFLFSNVFF